MEEPVPASDAPRRSRWRRAAFVVLGAAGAVPPLAFGLDEATRGERVARGVTMAGVPLGGLEGPELEARLDEVGRRVAGATIPLRLETSSWTLDPSAIDAAIDRELALRRAHAVGREPGLLARLRGFGERVLRGHPVEPPVVVSSTRLSTLIDGWESRYLTEPPVDLGLERRGDEVTLREPRAGLAVDRPLLEERLREALAGLERAEVVLPLARRPGRGRLEDLAELDGALRRLLSADVSLVEERTQAVLPVSRQALRDAIRARLDDRGRLALEFEGEGLLASVEERAAALSAPPRGAELTVVADRVQVVPSAPAVALDARRLSRVVLEAASTPGRVAPLPLAPQEPAAFDTEAALGLGVRRLLAKFTTFHPCCQTRVQNIHRAAAILHGRWVAPGATFSLNDTLGPRTQKNGFVPAPTIEEGEMRDSPGGGVSQLATTFFNAVFRAGLDVIERQAHTYWFPRYPEGIEATLSWPKPDVVFRNDTASAVLIQTRYDDTSVTVSLFGNPDGRRVEWKVSPRQDIVRPIIEYLPEPELDPEEEKVREAGMMGWSVWVTRKVTFQDGAAREDKRKITYKMRPRRLAVHPCKIPRGEPDYTGERCPEPQERP